MNTYSNTPSSPVARGAPSCISNATPADAACSAKFSFHSSLNPSQSVALVVSLEPETFRTNLDVALFGISDNAVSAGFLFTVAAQPVNNIKHTAATIQRKFILNSY